MKKEARVAHVEALPGGFVLVVVFRGGWIDGISAFPPGAGIAGRLEGSRYLQELRGVSVGGSLGGAHAAELRAWAEAKGLPEVGVGKRNAMQARVIAEGLAGILQGKG